MENDFSGMLREADDPLYEFASVDGFFFSGDASGCEL
jgi:hypothetical protein